MSKHKLALYVVDKVEQMGIKCGQIDHLCRNKRDVNVDVYNLTEPNYKFGF